VNPALLKSSTPAAPALLESFERSGFRRSGRWTHTGGFKPRAAYVSTCFGVDASHS
jgi:hypothetical protein